MKFYPADWRADAMLRLCSIAARGLWAEMMCIMHDAEIYGSLHVNGRRIDKKQLAGLAGISEKDCTALLLELEGNGVFSRDEDGTIYSRRMRRDAIKSEEGRKQVAKRWRDKKDDRSPIRSPIHEADDEPNTQKPEARIDRIGSASASGLTEGSKALTSAFWKALGFESALAVHPDYAGTDWRAIEWERAGWTVDLIDSETRRIGPAKPLTYYEKVFATAFAKRQAPLPIVEVREAETLTVKSNGKPKSAIIQAADDLCRKLASFDGPQRAVDELCSAEGEASPRLLSDR
jgi:hypothetical protein